MGQEAPSAYSAVSPFLHGFQTQSHSKGISNGYSVYLEQTLYLLLLTTAATNLEDSDVVEGPDRSDSRKLNEAVAADSDSALPAINGEDVPDGPLVGIAKRIDWPQTVEYTRSRRSSRAQQFRKWNCKVCMERPLRELVEVVSDPRNVRLVDRQRPQSTYFGSVG